MPSHTPRRRSPAAAALIALALVTTGCESRVPVTGRVVENGRPVAGAELRWAHQSDPNVFVSGVTDETGAYILDAAGRKDVPAGKYQVTVTWWRTKDGRPLPAGEEGAALKDTEAARQFAATVDVEVTPGSPNVDLDVTGKAAPVEDG